ncbi:MAG: M20/M25/M40 family metallo-hydrolase [Oscillospiraceae bacterium]|nr:M20/M25/M40 family metallo-hydrolase [Oscillospiraceae bacterium]
MAGSINAERAIERFQAMIRVKTVSNRKEGIDREAFAAFLPMLQENYPAVFAAAETQTVNEFGILMRWPGKNPSLAPVVLMAHHDVVSDEGQEWKHPAFAAEIHDGCIWGRGTIDTKCLIAGIFEAMDSLIGEGFRPERDIYFASSNCEEVAGDTMPKIVELFEKKRITPRFVLDEGGAIMSNLPMGIKKPYAMVAVSEKGWATVTLTARAVNAAHNAKSSGKKLSAPEKLVKALNALESSPMPAQITSALEGMLGAFAPCVPLPLGAVFKNADKIKPVLKKAMEGNADTAAMIRSVISLVSIEAPDENGAPAQTASAKLKVRIAPHDSMKSILEHIKNTVGEEIEVTAEKVSDPPRISRHKTESFAYLESTLKKVFPDIGVAPFILNAGTDSRHFSRICKEIYRFGAFRLDDELFATVHSANERIPVEDYLKCIEFYREFIGGLK